MMMDSSFALGLVLSVVGGMLYAFEGVVTEYLSTDDNFNSFLMSYITVSLYIILLPPHLVATYVWNDTENKNPLLLREGYESIPNNQQENNDNEALTTNECHEEEEINQTTPEETYRRVALQVAPVYFLACWGITAALTLTSVVSAIMVNSTATLFTFMFAVAFRDEAFTWIKFTGVMIGIVGMIVTTVGDSGVDTTVDDDDDDAVILNVTGGAQRALFVTLSQDLEYAAWGDLLSLFSACAYGLFAVLLRILLPKNQSPNSMLLVMGYVGVVTLVVLSPVALILFLRQPGLSWAVFGVACLKGTLDTVSNYFWVAGIMLTNATVASVGFASCIPFSFLCEYITGQGDVVKSYSYFGAVGFVIGFIMVTLASMSDEEEQPNKAVAANSNEMPLETITQEESLQEEIS